MGEDKPQLRSVVNAKEVESRISARILAACWGVLVIVAIAAIVIPLIFYRLPSENVPVPIVILFWVVYATILMFMFICEKRGFLREVSLWWAAALMLSSRIIYLIVRNMTDQTQIDLDIELYFGYGGQFASGVYPWMEYPQFSLLFFAFSFFLSGGNFTLFKIIFPLVQLPFELIILACTYKIGEKTGHTVLGSVLCMFYATLPYIMVFWFSKFDVVPTALFTLAIYCFIIERNTLSAALLALGFGAKWFPILAMPLLLLHLLREKGKRATLSFTLTFTSISAALTLPFALSSPDKFLYTYQFHSRRGMNGLSFFYFFNYFLEPSKRVSVPWHEFQSAYFSPHATTILLIIVLSTIFALSYKFSSDSYTTAFFSFLTAPSFAIFNRIYSPQYIVWLIVSYMNMYLLIGNRTRAGFIPLLLAGPLLNFLVWPRVGSYSFMCTGLFWTACWAMLLNLAEVYIRRCVPKLFQ